MFSQLLRTSNHKYPEISTPLSAPLSEHKDVPSLSHYPPLSAPKLPTRPRRRVQLTKQPFPSFPSSPRQVCSICCHATDLNPRNTRPLYREPPPPPTTTSPTPEQFSTTYLTDTAGFTRACLRRTLISLCKGSTKWKHFLVVFNPNPIFSAQY